MTDRIAEEFQQAREARSDADAMRRADVSDEAIVNRLYYACFHAAQAVLYANGVEPTTHGAVVSLFGEEVVLAGEASRADGRFLNDLRDLRLQADYRFEPIDANVDELFERADRFVTEMETLV